MRAPTNTGGRRGTPAWLHLLLAAMFYGLSSGAMVMASPVDDIVKKVEDNLNGKTAFMKFTMVVETKRGKRTMKMDSWAIGKDKSFIRITYPGKDSGITFLKVDKAMWQYVPRIEKTIKIPASMMLQSWMGSDFTNDDLVRESSISDDYNASLVAEDDAAYTLDLFARPEAPVVWGRIRMQISKKYFLPTTVNYYDEGGGLVRILEYLDVARFGARFYPTHWVMRPQEAEKEGHLTEILVDDAVFDEPIDEAYFSKRALKRFSQ